MRRVSRMAMGLWWIAASSVGNSAPAAAAESLIGKPAPALTLTDASGRARALEEWRGRVVVLEWFNNECPFVNKQYASGNMQRLQGEFTARGVIWLTIASSAPGRQGYLTPGQARLIITQRGTHQTALLLDPDGTVGRRYGATTTPTMVVINGAGTVVYLGAIDDKPSTDPADVPRASNYVRRALEEVLAGQAVSVPETKSYGCSVKY